MKCRYSGIHYIVLLITIMSVFTSCKEEWDNHYYAVPANKIDSNLYAYIASRNDLKTFTQMIQISGYDSILSQSQTYTVWAPVDSALNDIDLNNVAEVSRIVANHITRFSHPTSDISFKKKTFVMLSSKLQVFEKNEIDFTFNGIKITEPDLATSNGIVHVIGNYSPYVLNFWEFIEQKEGLDSLRAYFNSLTKLVLDEEASYDDDNVLVDSIFKESNLVLDYFAALNVEDSIYTAILPTNEAWSNAYNQIFPYFKSLPIDGGTQTQRDRTRMILISDLFFKSKIGTPVGKDTLLSTNRNKFANPDRLFTGAQLTKMSNGNSYITNQLQAKPFETWLKEIRIEAEYMSGRTPVNYNVSTVSSIGTGYSISKGYYLTALPSSTSDLVSINNMSIKFALPNTLSCKYNIYCVFVPTIIVDANDLKPNKVRFFMSYVKSDGSQATDLSVNASNQLSTSSTISSAAIFQNDQKTMNKMLVVKDFQFPYSNQISYNASTMQPSPTTVFLRVNNAAKVTGTDAAFSRTLRIDCIILEPVQ